MQDVVSVERVRALLAYTPNTWRLVWKTYRNSQAQKGQEAGHISASEGYRLIGIDGKLYKAHRLAWLLHFGRWPAGQIDHINHDRLDNRISNLREVSQVTNLRNKSKSKANSSEHTGVYKTAVGNWIARICVNRKQINLGTFLTLEEAVAARELANSSFKFHPNHGQ